MSAVIKSASLGQNALIESPTGTGKTVALLCSALSWQNKKIKDDATEASSPSKKERLDAPAVEAGPVKIFYASRTHAQLGQVVSELKRCPAELLAGPDGSGLVVTTLGGRDQYCVEPTVSAMHSAGKAEGCGELVASATCSYYASSQHLTREITRKIMDIEEVVAKGKKDISCPYYGSKRAVVAANIVFLPYAYLLSPVIRNGGGLSAMVENSVIIFDEAHNVEDACREAASAEVAVQSMQGVAGLLHAVARKNPGLGDACGHLALFLEGLVEWSQASPRGKGEIGDCNGGRIVLSGPAALDSIGSATGRPVTAEYVDTLIVYLDLLAGSEDGERAVAPSSPPGATSSPPGATPPSAPRADTSPPPMPGGRPKALPGGAVVIISSILRCFEFMLSSGAEFATDFKVAVISRKGGARSGEVAYSDGAQTECNLCIWCLRPAVAFRALATVARSIILASGTLAPLGSFASELGTTFHSQLQLGHVCDTRTQLLAITQQCVGSVGLRCTYDRLSEQSVLRALGQSVLTVVKETPGGVLVFFPSYVLMHSCFYAWQECSLMREMAEAKQVIHENKGTPDAFEANIRQYREACATGNGSVFFAVFRGRMSEGMDFRDDQARAVVIIGIPFPNTMDLVVALKKQHQDALRKNTPASAATKPLSGQEWYSLQAYRALNQAVGRVIRHKEDYGAIIFLDARFAEPGSVSQISKWARQDIKVSSNLAESADMLGRFFARHQPQRALQQ